MTAADCLAFTLLRYLCFMVCSNGGTEALAFVHAGQRSGPIRTIAIQCEDASRWQGAVISRVVYCTAVIDAATNTSGTTIRTSTSGRCRPPAALMPVVTEATLRA